MLLNSMSSGNDLRLRLGSRPVKPTQFRDAIQVVVTNRNATGLNSTKASDSEVILNVRALTTLISIFPLTIDDYINGFSFFSSSFVGRKKTAKSWRTLKWKK